MREVLARSGEVHERATEEVLQNRAAALNNLGVSYMQKKDPKSAEPFFAEACLLYERLAGSGSEISQGQAICLANAGALYHGTHYYLKAEKAYVGAMVFYERLAVSDPAGTNPYLSTLLIHLGNLYVAERKFRHGETALLEGLGILEQLVREDPEKYQRDLVQVLTSLANLYSAMSMMDEAEKRLLRALAIRESPLLHKRLGDLYRQKGEPAAARTHYERALEGYDAADGTGPAGPRAQTLIGYASLCYEEKDLIRAKELFSRAKEICESLVPAQPEAAGSDLSTILHYMSLIYNEENDTAGELAVLTLMAQLPVLHSKFNPIQGPVRADVLLNLASSYGRRKDFGGARDAYLSALEVFDWLENVNPGTYQSAQAGTLHMLGSLYREYGHLREAESTYNRSIVIRNKLAAAYPDIYEPALARTYLSLGKLYLRMEEKGRAISAYTLAVPLFQRLAAAVPAVYEPELLRVYQNLAAALLERGDRAAAKEVWEKALVIDERRVETDPTGHEHSLIYTLLNLANIDGFEKEYRLAEMHYKKALMIKLKYRHLLPEKFDHDTAKILRRMGRCFAAEKNWVAAEEHLLRALHLYDQLERARPGVYTEKKEDVLSILEAVYSDSAGAGEPTVAMMERQLEVYRQLELLHPGTHGPRIATLLTGLAGEYADTDNTVEALDARRQAHAIFETLIGNGWLEYRPPLAESLLWLAILHEQRKELAAADRIYRKCIDVYANMAADNGPAFHLKQANALMYYGKYLVGQGQTEAGKDQIDQAVQIARSYAEDDLAEGILEEAGKY